MSVVMVLFGLFWCLRRPSLGRCRHRMAGLRCLARTLASVSLVIVASTSMLSAILVALMGTCTKVLRSGAAISTPHWAALLAWVEDRLVVLHVGAHTVHRLSLLRSLMCHHRRRRTTRTRVAVNTGHWLRCRWRHESWVTSRIHHLRARNHALRSRHELLRHHHRASHLTLLGGHVLMVVRKVAELVHLRRARSHENCLVVLHLW